MKIKINKQIRTEKKTKNNKPVKFPTGFGTPDK
jgi:hypothetical protein